MNSAESRKSLRLLKQVAKHSADRKKRARAEVAANEATLAAINATLSKCRSKIDDPAAESLSADLLAVVRQLYPLSQEAERAGNDLQQAISSATLAELRHDVVAARLKQLELVVRRLEEAKELDEAIMQRATLQPADHKRLGLGSEDRMALNWKAKP